MHVIVEFASQQRQALTVWHSETETDTLPLLSLHCSHTKQMANSAPAHFSTQANALLRKNFTFQVPLASPFLLSMITPLHEITLMFNFLIFQRNGTWKPTFGWFSSRWCYACCFSCSNSYSTRNSIKASSNAAARVPTTGPKSLGALTQRSGAGSSIPIPFKPPCAPFPTPSNGHRSCNFRLPRTGPCEPVFFPFSICPMHRAGEPTRVLFLCSSPQRITPLRKVWCNGSVHIVFLALFADFLSWRVYSFIYRRVWEDVWECPAYKWVWW